MRPFGQRRQNPLLHVLRPRREHQQQLRGGPQFAIGRIEQHAPDLHADGRAAGLRRFQHLAPPLPQPRGQQAELRRFAAALRPFKGEKATAAV